MKQHMTKQAQTEALKRKMMSGKERLKMDADMEEVEEKPMKAPAVMRVVRRGFKASRY